MKETDPTRYGSVSAGIVVSRPAHSMHFNEVVDELHSNPEHGLSVQEAQNRLTSCGRNDLGNVQSARPGTILIRQIANAMTMILVMAMAVSFGIQAWIEGGVLAGVVVLNITVGFVQEFQAEKTMDSLRKLSSPTASVIRDGKQFSIPTSELVPGDMVEVGVGDTIPADIRLMETINFETDEALLTGESLPVRKNANAVFDNDTGPGDRLNLSYSSSIVTKGRARGIVFATGMQTEIGSIAAALRETSPRIRPVKRRLDGSASFYRHLESWGLTIYDTAGEFLGITVGTPLQRKLSKFAIALLGIAVICTIIVLGANGFSNRREVIVYAVATGLSMIPSSLVVVLTITMTVGTKHMVARHVIVRNLNSLEALGAVTDICSDKTGTLTQGKMVARNAWVPAEGIYSVVQSNAPFDPTVGEVLFADQQPVQVSPDQPEKNTPVTYNEGELPSNLEEFLRVASLANLAVVEENDGLWEVRGDPTEIALQVFASRFKRDRSLFGKSENSRWKSVVEFPFDSDVKKMSVVYEDLTSGSQLVFTKGAVERVIVSCTSIFLKGASNPQPVTDEIRDNILANMEVFASQGLRVLALASKRLSYVVSNDDEEINRNDIEEGLTFRGLIGIYDPPRAESGPSVQRCHEAGISVHMLTGDHPGTARAIAIDVGILPSNAHELSKEMCESMVMTAHEFDKLSDDEIDALPALPAVVARCTPNTKVRMIRALHKRRKFAAMTGDGVNDSPSLKIADVGIAMGMAGSDVAKDASDIILTDDNFASILNAIEEGRRMFDNIQKFILHVLSQNFAQALILLVGLVFKDPEGLSVFPLSPVEIVWLVMITSGLPDMGLGFEHAAIDIMERPPRKHGLFTWEMLLDIFVYGTWVAGLCLGAFSLVLYGFGDGSIGVNCNNTYSEACDSAFRARATTFACLTWFVLFLAWEMVDMRRSFFNMRPIAKSSLEAQSSQGNTVVWRQSTKWCRDIWQNQFLFWSNVSGFLLVFPLIYIPVINQKVFRHTGISWEWGIVFVGTVLFFAGAEAWKWMKRAFIRRRESRKGVRKGKSSADSSV
ncbi:Na+ ATPase [Myotisia sp. PD_48]|nr:Na+ ATPase [Myotisia sp. PD_48]